MNNEQEYPPEQDLVEAFVEGAQWYAVRFGQEQDGMTGGALSQVRAQGVLRYMSPPPRFYPRCGLRPDGRVVVWDDVTDRALTSCPSYAKACALIAELNAGVDPAVAARPKRFAVELECGRYAVRDQFSGGLMATAVTRLVAQQTADELNAKEGP